MKYGMTQTTTDGKEIFIELGCPHCNISTGGQHEYNCPNYKKLLPQSNCQTNQLSEKEINEMVSIVSHANYGKLL